MGHKVQPSHIHPPRHTRREGRRGAAAAAGAALPVVGMGLNAA